MIDLKGFSPYGRERREYQSHVVPCSDHVSQPIRAWGEIAEREGMTQQAVDLVLQETAELPKLVKPAAEHLTDFEKRRPGARAQK